MADKQSNKFKLFIENFLVYGVGGVISKIIPLIMLPIITYLLPDTESFGLSDLSNTIISFASAFAIMGMYDAMYRLFFEREDNEFKKKVCSSAFCFTIITSIIVTVIMVLGKDIIAKLFLKDEKYSYLVIVSAMATLVSATNSIISAPTRMQNNRKLYLLANTIGPVMAYAIAIPLILYGYYIIALPLASLISGIIIEFSFCFLNRNWFSFKLIDRKILKELLRIGIPLLPNFLIFWVFNSSDKVMITNIIDVGASGVYSVGAKLGHVSQLIYTAFAGGWQFFAFSTMKEKNQVESNSKVFEYLGVISFVAAAFVFPFSKSIFEIFFADEYLEGYMVAPYLFLAPLMQMLFQVIGNQFLVIKMTWPSFFILFSGAIVNVILNLVLIPKIGIEGAAIATLLGYIFSDIICCIVLLKMKLMIISKKFIFSSIIMSIYIVSWRFLFFDKLLIGLLIAITISSIMGYLYKKDLFMLIDIIKRRFASKR